MPSRLHPAKPLVSKPVTFSGRDPSTYTPVMFKDEHGKETDVVDVGTASAWIAGTIVWEHGKGETLTLRPARAHEASLEDAAQLPHGEQQGALRTATPLACFFERSKWSDGGDAANVSFETESHGFRYWRFELMGDVAAGSAVVRLGIGGR